MVVWRAFTAITLEKDRTLKGILRMFLYAQIGVQTYPGLPLCFALLKVSNIEIFKKAKRLPVTKERGRFFI